MQKDAKRAGQGKVLLPGGLPTLGPMIRVFPILSFSFPA
jgi:hypothetical protein